MLFTAFNSNMPAESFYRAEEACISLGSHVQSFDYGGEAICKNSATIDYLKYTPKGD